MIDRVAIAKLTEGERKSYAIALVILVGFFLAGLYFFGSIILDEYRLDKRYEIEALQVEGEVTAFRYFQATGKNPERFTGYYPKVTFATPTGLVTVDASTGSPLALADQPAMLGRKVNVRYLPEKPMHGRVVQWPRTFALDALPLVTLLVLAALGTLYFAWVMWPTGGSVVRKAISR